MSKDSKIRVLENFYALDYTLFSKPLKKLEFSDNSCGACNESLLNDYLTSKGALISTLVEMYKLINHNPTIITEKVDANKLGRMARNSARIARQNAKRLVCTEQGRESIKSRLVQSINESQNNGDNIDVDVQVQRAIREKSFSLAMDNLLVARAINESDDYSKLDDWEGKYIIEDSYKILRNSVIECAMEILENVN